MMDHLDRMVIKLTIDDELIETTPEHPFYELATGPWLAAGQYQRDWTNAGELEIGGLVWQAGGTTGTVESVEVVAVQQQTKKGSGDSRRSPLPFFAEP